MVWQTNNEQLTTKDFLCTKLFHRSCGIYRTWENIGGLKIGKWMDLNQLANKRLTNLISVAGKN